MGLARRLSPRAEAMDCLCVCTPLILGVQRWVLADGLCDPNLTRRRPAEQRLMAIPSAASALLLSNNFLTPRGRWVSPKHRKWSPIIFPFTNCFSIYSGSRGSSVRGAGALRTHASGNVPVFCLLSPSCSHCLSRLQMLLLGSGACQPRPDLVLCFVAFLQVCLCPEWCHRLFPCQQLQSSPVLLLYLLPRPDS